MAFIGRMLSTPIGLAAEAYEHNKEKKTRAASDAGEGSSRLTPQASATSGSRSPRPKPSDKNRLCQEELDGSIADPPPAYKRDEDEHEDESSLDEEEDEADWARDETQAQLEHDPQPAEELKSTMSVTKYVRQHVAAFPQNPKAASTRLEVPVIIPQRRPETRGRGFVRAYAPILEDSDVSQAAFLHFLDGFTAVIEGQKWFWAVNAAVLVAGLAADASAAVPSLTVHLVLPAIHWSIEGGRRAYESNAVNRYLDNMNDSYFKPRGLYALIMTHDPYSSKKAQQVSLNDNLMKSIQARDDHHLNNLHQSSGHAAELQIPESAPLVFPALEAASDEQKQSAFKRAGAFSRDYMDRRARTNFERENPTSKLNSLHQASTSYAAPIADPNHPMWHGGLLTLLSGGHIPSRRQRRRDRGRGRGGFQGDERMSRGEMLRLARKKGYTPLGFVKRTLGEHVVYLMILPYPTEREFAEYGEAQARKKAAREGHIID